MLNATACWECAHFDNTTKKCKANAVMHFMELSDCPWKVPVGMRVPEQLLDTIRKVIPCTIDNCSVGVKINKFNNYQPAANMELYAIEFTVCDVVYSVDVFILTTEPDDNLHYLYRFKDAVSKLIEVVKQKEGVYVDDTT